MTNHQCDLLYSLYGTESGIKITVAYLINYLYVITVNHVMYLYK